MLAGFLFVFNKFIPAKYMKIQRTRINKTLKKTVLWKTSNLYKSKLYSIMSSHLPLTQFQLLTTHGHFCFMYITPPPPVLPWIKS